MKKIFFFLITYFIFVSFINSYQDDYLKITSNVTPKIIRQGEEGILKIKIIPRNDIKISSHPEFIIKLNENSDLTFSKVFFTASELDFQTKQEENIVSLDLEKEIAIPFKVNEESLIGKHKISGEIVFTAVFKDHWSLKTYQKFFTTFSSRRNYKKKKR